MVGSVLSNFSFFSLRLVQVRNSIAMSLCRKVLS